MNTPPVTSARPTVPGPSGVVVTASMATVPSVASIDVPTGTSFVVRSWACSTGSVDGACVVAGATSTCPACGATVTFSPTSGAPTGAGSGAQFGSMPGVATIGVDPAHRPPASRGSAAPLT